MRGIIAHGELAAAPKLVWGPPDFISKVKFLQHEQPISKVCTNPTGNNLKCRLITQGTEGVARFMLRIQIVIYQLIFEIVEENCQGSNPLAKFF